MSSRYSLQSDASNDEYILGIKSSFFQTISMDGTETDYNVEGDKVFLVLPASGNINIHLPDPGVAPGHDVNIVAVKTDGTGTCTLKFNDGVNTDKVFNSVNDCIVVRSLGKRWVVLAEVGLA
ncbi:MAG: hypothetical protein ABIK73_06185 [candidate division WOR-3 bacterium]